MLWQLSQIVVTTLPCSNITPTRSLKFPNHLWQFQGQLFFFCFFLRPTRRAGLSLNSVSVQFYLYSGFFLLRHCHRALCRGDWKENWTETPGMNPQNSKQLSTKKVRKKIFLPRWEEKQSNGRRNLTPSTWAQSTRRNGSLSSPCVPCGCAPLSLSLFSFLQLCSLSNVALPVLLFICPSSSSSYRTANEVRQSDSF